MLRLTWVLMLFGLSACSSYQIAQSVKLVSFVKEPARAPAAILLHGQDCRHSLFGIDFGPLPSADLSVRDAQMNYNSVSSLRLPATPAESALAPRIRYINNFSLQESGFDTWVYARTCLIARGGGRL